MLSVNDLQILKEIQSLSNKIKDYQDEIISQNDRVLKIKQLKTDRINEKSVHDNQIITLNSEITSLELDNTKTSNQYDFKKSQENEVVSEKQNESLQAELQHLEDKLTELEDQLLETYEQFEQLTIQGQEFIEFFDNIENSIKEIENESTLEIQTLTKEINILIERISLLEQELEELARKKLASTKLRNLTPFITLIKDFSCTLCGMNIPSQTMTQIQNLNILSNCSGCSRLLIPEIALS